MYRIVVKPSAARELKKLPRIIATAIAKKIDGLADNPRPEGCKKLVGNKEDLWRVRVGNYRVLYAIDDTIRIVDIHHIGNRRDIYR
ncbi:type II toxin-antitoxin system RelE/ParE family toxin [Nemorincola caseinilytica]|uniref:Type II toxin-antitoxin system RelE/ParE family toxin n=1 Tax=Nemorincola caseinilytica TaxID=2054315 RepID=A0ABP8NEV4_9BACT